MTETCRSAQAARFRLRRPRARRLAPVLVAMTLAACAPERPPKNLVFISFDTTRKDHLSTYGYERETTPRLTELAADGARFKVE